MLSVLCCVMLFAAEAPLIDKPLLAYWTFDGESGLICHDSADNACDASPADNDAPGLKRTRGLFGNAMRFSGSHMLHAPSKPEFREMTEIALSVWVLPSDFEGYNDIFRKEDGEQRVLFSFQGDATILSLGLNLNGYIECDATIKPSQVLDGQWHHCAATFDGAFMRVYLDGDEVGSLERRGTIKAGGNAPGCIGSVNGGECFQGIIDELRIYGEALTPDEIALLYKSGLEAAALLAKEQQEALDAFYAQRGSFAETLSDSRKNLVEKAIAIDRDLANAAIAKLKAEFPEEYQDFVTWTDMNPTDYLLAKDAPIDEKIIAHLIELMIEYKPLTEHQRKNQTPEQLKQWQEAEEIQRRFEELKNQGDTTQFSPEWIHLIFDAAPRVEFRPKVQEAVAPYMKPTTPKMHDLTPKQVRRTLERDWLHQAGGKPTYRRVRDEIEWTRQLAARIATTYPDTIDFSSDLSDLSDISNKERKRKEPSAKLYLRVREIKRRIVFQNPVLDFNKMLFVDMPYPSGSEWNHETRHRLGYMAIPGGRLLILEGLGPEGKLTQLMPQAPLHGSFWRPDLSYDATKVLFCFKPHNEKSFHLYEINIDGTGLTQLTDGPYDDFDPIYLPDEKHIIFCTTRGNAYVRCGHGRRSRHLHPLGIHRQTPMARTKPMDHAPRRHPSQYLLG